MKLILNNDVFLEVNLNSLNEDNISFECNGKVFNYSFIKTDSSFKLKSLDKVETIIFSSSREMTEIFHQGKYSQIKIASHTNLNANDEKIQQYEYSSPMPGKISKIAISINQKIKKGDVLLYLEAMKIEHPIKSKMDGEIESIVTNVGDQVDQGQLLIKLKKL